MVPIASRMCSNRSARVGGTSEHLDEVVRNSRRKSWLDRTTHLGLGVNPGRIADDMLNADEVEQRELCAVVDLDQHVEIAVFTRVTTRSRSEDRKLRHTLGLEGRS